MGKICKEYHQKYYANRKQEYVDLLGGRCIKCGSKDNLEFDHIDKNSRKFIIIKILKRKKEIVLKELKKCQLLCSICHRKKSGKENQCGGRVKGEKSNLAKLSDNEVIEIKKRLNNEESCSSIAKKYGVTSMNIRCIKNGKSWRHINI